MRAALTQYRATLDPVLLLHTIREAQSALVASASPEVRETPSGESLSKFLAKLPGSWRQGEVRPHSRGSYPIRRRISALERENLGLKAMANDLDRNTFACWWATLPMSTRESTSTTPGARDRLRAFTLKEGIERAK